MAIARFSRPPGGPRPRIYRPPNRPLFLRHKQVIPALDPSAALPDVGHDLHLDAAVGPLGGEGGGAHLAGVPEPRPRQRRGPGGANQKYARVCARRFPGISINGPERGGFALGWPLALCCIGMNIYEYLNFVFGMYV